MNVKNEYDQFKTLDVYQIKAKKYSKKNQSTQSINQY